MQGRPADGAGCLLAVLVGFGFVALAIGSTAWAIGSLLWHGLRAVLGIG